MAAKAKAATTTNGSCLSVWSEAHIFRQESFEHCSAANHRSQY
jgi:hypothetical protein